MRLYESRAPLLLKEAEEEEEESDSDDGSPPDAAYRQHLHQHRRHHLPPPPVVVRGVTPEQFARRVHDYRMATKVERQARHRQRKITEVNPFFVCYFLLARQAKVGLRNS
jgi:hypothetical protein